MSGIKVILDQEDLKLKQSLKSKVTDCGNVIISLQSKVLGLGVYGAKRHFEAINIDCGSIFHLHAIKRDETNIILELSSCVHNDCVIGGQERENHHHWSRNK